MCGSYNVFNGFYVKELNKKYFKTISFQVWLNSILKPASDVFQSFAIAILILYAMGYIGSSTLEIGVLYAFTTYTKQFFNPIAELADNYTTIRNADKIIVLKHGEVVEKGNHRGLMGIDGYYKNLIINNKALDESIDVVVNEKFTAV